MGRSKITGTDLILKSNSDGKIWEFLPDKNQIRCLPCGIILECNFRTKTLARQHVSGAKHKKNSALFFADSSKQTYLSSPSKPNVKSEFFADLTEALVRSNIPLNKIESDSFRNFLEKYTKKSLPNESTLRRNYLPNLFEQEMKRTIQWTRNKPIFIIIDECTDPSGRFVLAILVGVLAEDASNPRLLGVRELNETNNQTVTQAINDSMIKLCDGQMDYSKLRVLISDSASYMLSAGSNLKLIFTEMLHLTCAAHGVQRIAEQVRANHPHVDRFVTCLKKKRSKTVVGEKDYMFRQRNSHYLHNL